MSNYTPDWTLTIDEQLFPMKSRCPFIVFMPNKPDKFGIKFWVLAEVESKYVYNLLPYLGAFEKEQRNGRPLAEDVAMRLTECIHDKGGYNVTTDNFFTSVHVAKLLTQKKISIVGTLRNNSKRITKEMTRSGDDLYDSKFYYNDETKCLFVNYQCKKKNVSLLSTMHNTPCTDDTEKKKPFVINFYNQNKVGVDVFDQMARQYTTHAASRRWPLAVWTNLLNIAALNSWIIFRKTTGSAISRHDYILKLVEGLRENYIAQKEPAIVHGDISLSTNKLLGKRRKCSAQNCNNATVTVCRHCLKPTCGNCGNGSYKVIECNACAHEV